MNRACRRDRRPHRRAGRGAPGRRDAALPALLRSWAARLGLRLHSHGALARDNDSDGAPAPGPLQRLRVTDTVLPAALQPRRADTTAVVGTALLHKANGPGYRRIAARSGRPESTVRRWLRRATPAHLEWMYQRGVQRLVQIAPDTLHELRYCRNLLRHALSVLAAAAYWDRRRCGFTDPPWTLIGVYTCGRLLGPPG